VAVTLWELFSLQFETAIGKAIRQLISFKTEKESLRSDATSFMS